MQWSCAIKILRASGSDETFIKIHFALPLLPSVAESYPVYHN